MRSTDELDRGRPPPRLASVHPAGGLVRRGAAGRDRSRGGHESVRHRRKRLHRRRLVAVVQRPRSPPSRRSTPRSATSSAASRTRRCSASRTSRRSSSPSGWSRIAPPGLTRVFYSDSGSTAVEVALKMAFQWWAQRGEPRAHRLHLPRERLPRRHDRGGLGRRHRAVPLALPPAAVRHLAGPGRRHRAPRRAASRSTATRSRR